MLAAVQLTQEEKARRLNVKRELVSYWETGARVPTTPQRRLLYAAFEIPANAWDEPAPAMRPVPPELLALGYRDMGEYLRGLVARLAHLANESYEKDPKLFARYNREAVAAYAQLGRYTGETLVIPEEKLARLPSLRRTSRRILDALRPWPEALQAVAETLEAIEGES